MGGAHAQSLRTMIVVAGIQGFRVAVSVSVAVVLNGRGIVGIARRLMIVMPATTHDCVGQHGEDRDEVDGSCHGETRH